MQIVPSDFNTRRNVLFGGLCVLGAVSMSFRLFKKKGPVKGIATAATNRDTSFLRSPPAVRSPQQSIPSPEEKSLPDFSLADVPGHMAEIGSKVAIPEIEDVHHDSLWDGSDSIHCGRTGFIKRVDPDGDVEVSFSDGGRLVCDIKFLHVIESPSQSQLVKSPQSDGLSASSINSTGTIGAMASSFCELGPR